MDSVGATRHPYNSNHGEIRLTWKLQDKLDLTKKGNNKTNLLRVSHPVLTMVALSHSADNADTVSGLIRGTYTRLFIPNAVALIKSKIIFPS